MLRILRSQRTFVRYTGTATAIPVKDRAKPVRKANSASGLRYVLMHKIANSTPGQEDYLSGKTPLLLDLNANSPNYLGYVNEWYKFINKGLETDDTQISEKEIINKRFNNWTNQICSSHEKASSISMYELLWNEKGLPTFPTHDSKQKLCVYTPKGKTAIFTINDYKRHKHLMSQIPSYKASIGGGFPAKSLEENLETCRSLFFLRSNELEKLDAITKLMLVILQPGPEITQIRAVLKFLSSYRVRRWLNENAGSNAPAFEMALNLIQSFYLKLFNGSYSVREKDYMNFGFVQYCILKGDAEKFKHFCIMNNFDKSPRIIQGIFKKILDDEFLMLNNLNHLFGNILELMNSISPVMDLNRNFIHLLMYNALKESDFTRFLNIMDLVGSDKNNLFMDELMLQYYFQGLLLTQNFSQASKILKQLSPFQEDSSQHNTTLQARINSAVAIDTTNRQFSLPLVLYSLRTIYPILVNSYILELSRHPDVDNCSKVENTVKMMLNSKIKIFHVVRNEIFRNFDTSSRFYSSTFESTLKRLEMVYMRSFVTYYRGIRMLDRFAFFQQISYHKPKAGKKPKRLIVPYNRKVLTKRAALICKLQKQGRLHVLVGRHVPITKRAIKSRSRSKAIVQARKKDKELRKLT